jgi:hypothetical protein
MKQSPITKLLLPSVLMSSLCFAGLMIICSQLRSNEAIPILRSPSEYRLESDKARFVLPPEYANWRVRQVGFVIMVSVSVGILTVEGLRRWYGFQNSGAIKAKELGLEDFLLDDSVKPMD